MLIPGRALEEGFGAPIIVEGRMPSPAVARDGTRGPYWSWASVDGGVEWEDWSGGFYAGELSEIKWLARVESVRVKTITPDLFGQVASGSLVITGPLGVLKVTENKSPKPNMPGDVLEACDYSADIFWDSKDLHERFGGERTSAIWS
ncbi:hypothetical protein N7504_011292 [Penicillium tannophilum]|nr:hypothetical protein N7504_011292 [Penicillium tannophilum]